MSKCPKCSGEMDIWPDVCPSCGYDRWASAEDAPLPNDAGTPKAMPDRCTCAPYSMPDDGGMCSYCERAIEEEEADARNEAHARPADEEDFLEKADE